ncbi:MAG: hypothetical protein A2268_05925 [Candidatus Raymondbacteria bacterium RifOxyA12_full_50_37]|uniref:Haloacid dehalogenase n=1 Tax=Candidatus Raymondbacteria bacterium RIFOXYD12_FULL_49_13 TaxID=1817890 RepID=A0A1F7FFY7_UNCRA|nr:MAG: hypothetical protein A2268_05925 [Candidatus Raymondbacteria bacterium RifOxyA12_full_50_37]OGJ94278.1 MAG: hypothetical protein A2248_14855 [Candidatus Raymondbacteria bacterium RIFOXYA2_FULL_49_16]OGJ96389.1 MAG: hypothetical protein A2487_00455 [Candidatus Raymondbacteria bacterium RifOxyC12_full_50_8]OGJ99108.1 MAG: hypothetical protein A2453_11265 [Candidatus Raymondbacteria bacterium RIFOXYC2_FULL_50_21]OGK01206.1 MAG: hypothetical protein A2350_01745 [Candidatus Raymondbacteria b
MDPERLLLCDIDGTLLHTGGAGMRAFSGAVQEALGTSLHLTPRHFAGKLDCIIFTSILESAGFPFAQRRTAWETFTRKYCELLRNEARLTGQSWTVYPGVRDFLERHKNTWRLALLTGNIPEGARIKLTTVGLWDFFVCGAFGDSGDSRGDLAVRALKECERRFGVKGFNDIWVIGDTVADIECGKRIAAKTLGVRTGFAKKGALEKAGADRVTGTLEGVTL